MGIMRIITLSNKPDYLQKCVASVKAQTVPCLHIIGHDHPGYDWGNRYPPAVFFNQQIRAADPDDLICWLSDDDILMPNFVEEFVKFFDEYRDVGAAYCKMLCVKYELGKDAVKLRDLPPEYGQTFNEANLPMYKMDSGQVVFRVKKIKNITLFSEYMHFAPEYSDDTARVNDGIMLNRWCEYFPIMPLPYDAPLCVGRITPKSAHTQLNEKGNYTAVDWRERRNVD